MPNEIDLIGVKIPSNIYIPVGAALFLLLWTLLGLSLKAIVFGRLKAWTSKTSSRLDDLIVNSLNFPLSLLIFASGILILVRAGISTQSLTHNELYHALLITGTISIVLFVDRLLSGIITTYSDKVEVFRVAGGLVQSCARGIVLIVGVLVLLGTLGINITPLLASLGVGSLAVALALQPTLENFFSGIQVISDRQIMEGQFIRLETGEEGIVHKINMRSTWLKTSVGNMLVFPNKLLVTTRITNYHYPNKEMDLPVVLSVHQNSDLDKVERVALDVASALQKEFPGALKTHTPVVRYNLVGESSITVTVGLRVEENTYLGAVRHEFLKRIIKRFRDEKIVLPYPVRAINLSQENAEWPKAV